MLEMALYVVVGFGLGLIAPPVARGFARREPGRAVVRSAAVAGLAVGRAIEASYDCVRDALVEAAGDVEAAAERPAGGPSAAKKEAS